MSSLTIPLYFVVWGNWVSYVHLGRTLLSEIIYVLLPVLLKQKHDEQAHEIIFVNTQLLVRCHSWKNVLSLSIWFSEFTTRIKCKSETERLCPLWTYRAIWLSKKKPILILIEYTLSNEPWTFSFRLSQCSCLTMKALCCNMRGDQMFLAVKLSSVSLSLFSGFASGHGPHYILLALYGCGFLKACLSSSGHESGRETS